MPFAFRQIRFLPLLCSLSAVFMLSSLGPAAVQASEAIKFEIDFFEHGAPDPMNHATVWVSGRRIRVEQRAPNGDLHGPVLVYLGDRNEILSISDHARSYAKLERETLSLLEGRTRRARREVDGQLQNLPSDQRKAFERLLGVSRQDPNMAENPVVVTSQDEMAEVAGFECKRVVMSRSDFAVGEACIASWDRIGLTEDDMEVFRALANFQRDAMGNRALTPMELVPNQPLDLITQFGGLPLSFERRVKGNPRSAIRVSSVERVPTLAVLFEAPTDYALRPGYGAFLSLLASTQSGRAPKSAATTNSAAVPAAPDPLAGSVESPESEKQATASDPAVEKAPARKPKATPRKAAPRSHRPSRRSISLFP